MKKRVQAIIEDYHKKNNGLNKPPKIYMSLMFIGNVLMGYGCAKLNYILVGISATVALIAANKVDQYILRLRWESKEDIYT